MHNRRMLPRQDGAEPLPTTRTRCHPPDQWQAPRRRRSPVRLQHSPKRRMLAVDREPQRRRLRRVQRPRLHMDGTSLVIRLLHRRARQPPTTGPRMRQPALRPARPPVPGHRKRELSPTDATTQKARRMDHPSPIHPPMVTSRRALRTRPQPAPPPTTERPAMTTRQPETLRQAQRWDARKRSHQQAGLCSPCAAALAWGSDATCTPDHARPTYPQEAAGGKPTTT